MKASLLASTASRSQPSATLPTATAQMAMPLLWLIEIVAVSALSRRTTSGSPVEAAITSISLSDCRSLGNFRLAATAHFAVHRPSRQSERRLANRRPLNRADSLSLSQTSAAGTSLSRCSSQYTSVMKPGWEWPHQWPLNSRFVAWRSSIPFPWPCRIPPHGSDKDEGLPVEECGVTRPLRGPDSRYARDRT